MIRTLAYLAAAALAASASVSAAQPLRLATSPDYRPYAFHDTTGRLTGFDIALGDAICARIPADCVWIEESFTKLLPGLVEGRFDAVIAALAMTAERRALVDFTDSYEDSIPEGVFVGVDVAEADLDTMSVGVAADTIHEHHLLETGVTPRRYASTADAYDALLAGEVDLVFGSPGELEPRIFRTSRSAAIVGREDIEAGSAAIAVRKNDHDLRQTLDRALASLRADGTLSRLRKTWMSPTQDL